MRIFRASLCCFPWCQVLLILPYQAAEWSLRAKEWLSKHEGNSPLFLKKLTCMTVALKEKKKKDFLKKEFLPLQKILKTKPKGNTLMC